MIMVSIVTSHCCDQLLWLNILILLFTILYTTKVSCTISEISYGDHCASVVPESAPTAPEFTNLPFLTLQNGYYDGGDKILNPNPSEYSSSKQKANKRKAIFHTENIYSTDSEGVYKVDGSLFLYSRNPNFMAPDVIYPHSIFRGMRLGKGALIFSLKGFWSNSSGKLCMVGSSSSFSPGGNFLRHAAVLKLDGVRTSSNITSLVSGTLQSLSSDDDLSYFEPISLLIFPVVNYKYTMVSQELIENEFSDEINAAAEKSSLRLPMNTTICSLFKRSINSFKLEYRSDCSSSETCNLFGDAVGYLPRVMSLNEIQCPVDGQSMKFLMEFPNSSSVRYYHPFNPKATFIGEGSWDWNKNRLHAVACRILNSNGTLDGSHVEDCSIRFTLRFC